MLSFIPASIKIGTNFQISPVQASLRPNVSLSRVVILCDDGIVSCNKNNAFSEDILDKFIKSLRAYSKRCMPSIKAN